MKAFLIMILILPLTVLGDERQSHKHGFAEGYSRARTLKLEKERIEIERQRLELERQRVEIERQRARKCYTIGDQLFCGGKQCTRIGDQLFNC